jgi:hypothetical protein
MVDRCERVARKLSCPNRTEAALVGGAMDSRSQVAVNGSGADRFLEMNHLAGQGTGHTLYGLDLGDDQSSERINVIGSNAGNSVVAGGPKRIPAACTGTTATRRQLHVCRGTRLGDQRADAHNSYLELIQPNPLYVPVFRERLDGFVVEARSRSMTDRELAELNRRR